MPITKLGNTTISPQTPATLSARSVLKSATSPWALGFGAMDYASGSSSIGGAALGGAGATAGSEVASQLTSKLLTRMTGKAGKVVPFLASLVGGGLGYSGGKAVGDKLIPIHKRVAKPPQPAQPGTYTTWAPQTSVQQPNNQASWASPQA